MSKLKNSISLWFYKYNNLLLILIFIFLMAFFINITTTKVFGGDSITWKGYAQELEKQIGSEQQQPRGDCRHTEIKILVKTNGFFCDRFQTYDMNYLVENKYYINHKKFLKGGWILQHIVSGPGPKEEMWVYFRCK